MEMKIKTFTELTTRELYEILRLRSEVFIVEQGGIYQDLDGIDYRSIHAFLEDEECQVVGCLRVFVKEDEPGTVQLGRIVTRERKKGYGGMLMQEAERISKETFHASRLYLTGRKSAAGFYLRCGFQISSDELGTADSPYYEFRRSLL